MLAIETLHAADLYEWLGCQAAVALHLDCNQSTVSRRIKEVMWLRKISDNRDHVNFLQLERRLHQLWRFKKGTRLRVHLYPWLNKLVTRGLPSSWSANPSAIATTAGNPIQLLEQHVIDALLAPAPLVADLDPTRFGLLPVYSTPLLLLADSRCELAQEAALSLAEISDHTELAMLPFVPEQASDCTRRLDAELLGGPSSLRMAGQRRYWGTILTPLVHPRLVRLDCRQPARYTEFLVCLREWLDHGEMLRLLTAVHNALRFRQQELADLEMLELTMSTTA